jgi:hypothetical protein
MEDPMSTMRRVRALAAAFTLTLVQATPAIAVAGGGLPAWACAPGDTAGSIARGGIADSHGVIREKDTGQAPNAGALPKSAQNAAPANLSVTVDVWVHVISSGSTGNVTNQVIADQISELNEGYAGGEGGDDTGFTFELAGVTRTNNATWYRSKGGAETAFKQALKVGGPETLNVYTTSGGGYLGWAYLPSITTSSQAYLDGVVIDWRTMPGASTAYAGRYDAGDTLVHEVGHWLNLEHTFYGGCSGSGDFVADTPPEKSAASGCPVGRDTCTSAGLDPIHNYMDYSDDPCITEFTAGQTQRMADAWVFWRAP